MVDGVRGEEVPPMGWMETAVEAARLEKEAGRGWSPQWKRGEAGWMDDPARRGAMFAEDAPGETGQPDPTPEAVRAWATSEELASLSVTMAETLRSIGDQVGQVVRLEHFEAIEGRLKAIESWVAELGSPIVRRVADIEDELMKAALGRRAATARVNERFEQISARMTLLEETTVADDEQDEEPIDPSTTDAETATVVERLAGKVALLEQTIVELRRRIVELAAERDRFRQRAVELDSKLTGRRE